MICARKVVDKPLNFGLMFGSKPGIPGAQPTYFAVSLGAELTGRVTTAQQTLCLAVVHVAKRDTRAVGLRRARVKRHRRNVEITPDNRLVGFADFPAIAHGSKPLKKGRVSGSKFVGIETSTFEFDIELAQINVTLVDMGHEQPPVLSAVLVNENRLSMGQKTDVACRSRISGMDLQVIGRRFRSASDQEWRAPVAVRKVRILQIPERGGALFFRIALGFVAGLADGMDIDDLVHPPGLKEVVRRVGKKPKELLVGDSGIPSRSQTKSRVKVRKKNPIHSQVGFLKEDWDAVRVVFVQV